MAEGRERESRVVRVVRRYGAAARADEMPAFFLLLSLQAGSYNGTSHHNAAATGNATTARKR